MHNNTALTLLLTFLAAQAIHAQTTLSTSTSTSTSTSSLIIVNGITSTSTTTSGGASAATTTTTNSGVVVQLSTNNNPADWTDGPSWLHTHWQWVVMIVILAVALTAGGIIGTIVYKRKSKSRQRGVNNTAPMASNPTIHSWAPSRHSVHDFGTPTRNVSPPPMPPVADESRRQSRRLGKAPAATMI